MLTWMSTTFFSSFSFSSFTSNLPGVGHPLVYQHGCCFFLFFYFILLLLLSFLSPGVSHPLDNKIGAVLFYVILFSFIFILSFSSCSSAPTLPPSLIHSLVISLILLSPYGAYGAVLIPRPLVGVTHHASPARSPCGPWSPLLLVLVLVFLSQLSCKVG